MVLMYGKKGGEGNMSWENGGKCAIVQERLLYNSSKAVDKSNRYLRVDREMFRRWGKGDV